MRPLRRPALASEVAQLAAALSSFEDAQARLRQMGVNMSIRRIANVAYHFAQRARRRQELDGMGIEGSLAGKRVVISTDGGRLRVRKNKRGQKTKKGRSRYHTDWREPKLLVIYVVDEKGRIAQEFAPVMDGTLKGPDEVFRLMEFYLRQLEIHRATEVLFIADGAKWIWQRVTKLWQRLGLVGVRCRELVDFYHVVEHVYALAALNTSWRASHRKRMGHPATAPFVARGTEGVHRGCGAALSGKTGQGLGSRTGLLAAQCPGRASGLRQGASGEDADRQRHDGERDSPGSQLAIEGSGHLLA